MALLIAQSWAERVASLRERGAVLGYERVVEGVWTRLDGFVASGEREYAVWDTVMVDERNPGALFPGEAPSDEPRFHGLRAMTDDEAALVRRHGIDPKRLCAGRSIPRRRGEGFLCCMVRRVVAAVVGRVVAAVAR